jgi:anti-anti-sigma regulatory factor
MEFKIDTKETYTIITPNTACLDANLTAALSQKCAELAKNGSINYIIDLQHCITADSTSFGDLLQMHEDCYNNSCSLVFTAAQDKVFQALKDKEIDLSLNIVPKMIEAIDIISMEILERDLFSEEE